MVGLGIEFELQFGAGNGTRFLLLIRAGTLPIEGGGYIVWHFNLYIKYLNTLFLIFINQR